MQIWIDSEDSNYEELEMISRFWTGFSNEVSEVIIGNSSDQEEAMSLIGLVPWILVRFSDWKMVPLENLIAASRGSGTRIAAAIKDEIDLNGSINSLDVGVDAILVPKQLMDKAKMMIGEKLEFVEKADFQEPSLVEAEITSIESAGIGERACVDLTRRLKEGQGIATGSISGKLCLIHGETIQSDYVPTRPFRVNAGAIHSYALLPNGRTKYLSELKSGDQVSIVSNSGIYESAIIGRIKIENRPLLLIRFMVSDSHGQIIVQQAETVRIVTPAGEAVSVTELSAGDRILVIADPRLRHVGIALKGRGLEK